MLQTLAVAEYLNFRQAATAFGVAQPGGGSRERRERFEGFMQTLGQRLATGNRFPRELPEYLWDGSVMWREQVMLSNEFLASEARAC